MKAVIATTNLHKLEEYQRMLERHHIEVYSLKDFNIDVDVEETGKDFLENAYLKAEEIYKRLDDKEDICVIGDDSGLSIESLGGFPGLKSARFMENHPYLEKQLVILNMMKRCENRDAKFTCAIAFIYKNKKYGFIGETKGCILKNICGSSGFGYDPIFYSYDLKKSFGEASGVEKDSVSHRGRALDKLEAFLKDELHLL